MPIKNIDKAPGGAAANWMFHKDGQGVIVVNVGDKNIYHCRWAIAADRREADRLNLALAAHYAGKTTTMTPTSFMFDVNGRDIIAISDLKPADKGTLFEVHTMAFDPKELGKDTKK